MKAYEEAGVRVQGEALSAVARHLGPTLAFPEGAEVLTGFGAYASVLKVSDDVAVAISTDGVGSKTLVASSLGRYDTIGFDLMAMNVNDVICVGARPVALVDYVGVNTLDGRRIEEILRGLAAAACEARVAVPGGEIAQLPGIIGDGAPGGDEGAFDLVGTCIGIVHPERLVLGGDVAPGDVLVGIASSGIHSNGLTLARRALLQDAGYRLEDEVPRLGRTLGEELLEPTTIYVRAVEALKNAGVAARGLVHITGDGLANLCRLEARVGYEIIDLPPRPEIFSLIQEAGGIDDAEMYGVFNMGVGFVVVAAASDAATATAALDASGYRAQIIGRTTEDEGGVTVGPARLVGGLEDGDAVFRPG